MGERRNEKEKREYEKNKQTQAIISVQKLRKRVIEEEKPYL